MKARSPEQQEKDRQRSRAWHARQKGMAEAWKDGRMFDGPTVVGALYDAIWELDLPRVDKVDAVTVRMVLFAMAKHLHALKLRRRDYSVWPSAQLVADLIERGERQVRRVLDALEEHGLIEQVRPAGRPGRGRRGHPPVYRLCLERWPGRTKNGSDTGVQAMAGLGLIVPPVTNGSDTGGHRSNGSDTGGHDQGHGSDTGVHRNRQVRETGNEDGKPAREPGNPRVRAREGDFQNDREFATQLAFPPIVVSGAVPAGQAAPRAEPPAVPFKAACPDCHQPVGRFTGKGHAAECWRQGVPSSDPWFALPREELEAVIAAQPVAAEVASS